MAWTNTIYQYTRHETNAYKLECDRFGFYTLTRKHDGASAFFQGDDANFWDRNMKADYDEADYDEERANQSFDCLCSGYDDVLELIS